MVTPSRNVFGPNPQFNRNPRFCAGTTGARAASEWRRLLFGNHAESRAVGETAIIFRADHLIDLIDFAILLVFHLSLPRLGERARIIHPDGHFETLAEGIRE